MNDNEKRTVRYIHAADLHLDRPFSGLPINDPDKLATLQKAPYQALQRLGSLCETERPDFVVIAGDVYDQEERSIKSQLALRDFCLKLASLKIPVFIVHGNHDPLSSRLQAITWPENVTIFNQQVYAVPVYKNNEIIAYVHGISHMRNPEKENLSLNFKRLPDYDGFQLGLLHCAITGSKGAESYAPCSLENLEATGLDAWALGHVHSVQMLSSLPYIGYSGTTQGSHINEDGSKGCLSVSAKKNGCAWDTIAEFRPLAPLIWENLKIDITGLNSLNEVEDQLLEELENLLSSVSPGIMTVICRIKLVGRTEIHNQLRMDSTLQTFAERLSTLETHQPALYIKDIQADTQPDISRNIAEQQDLLGEIWRLAEKLQAHPEELAILTDKIISPLYKSSGAKFLIRPDETTAQEILQKALVLCQEALESN